jgi:hypothetical protein
MNHKEYGGLTRPKSRKFMTTWRANVDNDKETPILSVIGGIIVIIYILVASLNTFEVSGRITASRVRTDSDGDTYYYFTLDSKEYSVGRNNYQQFKVGDYVRFTARGHWIIILGLQIDEPSAENMEDYSPQ